MHACSVLPALPLVALTLFAGCQATGVPVCADGPSELGPRSETPPPSITVTGFGNVPAAPDTATIHISTQTRDADAGAAISGSNAKIGRITAALAGLGVTAADIQVISVGMSGASGSPHGNCHTDDQCAMDEICDNGTCVFSGVGGPPAKPPRDAGSAAVSVEQQLVVTLRDPGKLGDLLTQAVAAGSGDVQSVAFSIGDPDELNRQAREDAMADARARAEQLAAGLGAALGPVMTITEAAGGFDQMGAYAGSGPPRMYTQVTVTYRLR